MQLPDDQEISQGFRDFPRLKRFPKARGTSQRPREILWLEEMYNPMHPDSRQCTAILSSSIHLQGCIKKHIPVGRLPISIDSVKIERINKDMKLINLFSSYVGGTSQKSNISQILACKQQSNANLRNYPPESLLTCNSQHRRRSLARPHRQALFGGPCVFLGHHVLLRGLTTTQYSLVPPHVSLQCRLLSPRLIIKEVIRSDAL